MWHLTPSVAQKPDISDGRRTKPRATLKDNTQRVLVSLLSGVSTAASAHHCLVLSHYPAAMGAGAAAVLNFETDGPSVGCQMVSGQMTRLFGLAVDERDASARISDGQAGGETTAAETEIKRRWRMWCCYISSILIKTGDYNQPFKRWKKSAKFQ